MLNIVDAKKRIDSILEIIGPEFFTYLCAEIDDDYQAILPDNMPYNSIWSYMDSLRTYSIGYASGESRMVIWDNRFPDYVMKIATDTDNEKYNEHELELYERAIKDNVEEAFAWMQKIYDIGDKCKDRAIYAMEFIKCDEEEISSHSYQYQYENYLDIEGLEDNEETQQSFYDNYWQICDDNEDLMDWMRSTWKWSLAEKVEQFICDNDISDIHSGNVGIRPNSFGEAVMVDYCGWDW